MSFCPKSNMNRQSQLHLLGNLLGLGVICTILIMVFIDQLWRFDLPCPLCLLQRTCFIAIGLTILMNLYQGIKPSHYGLMILATLLGLAVSMRQVTLHLTVNDPGYGFTFLGEYLYTWSAIGFTIIMILIAMALIFERGFNVTFEIQNKYFKALVNLFLFLILTNGVSTFIECGPYICPSDPTGYYFFNTHTGF
jgi:disulfide bond formation protein DsbB